MIFLKISPKVAEVLAIQPKDLKEYPGNKETNFFIDVENVNGMDDDLFNFYYMNEQDELIQSFPFRTMFEGQLPKEVFGPSIVGDVQRGIFFDGLPYTKEVADAVRGSAGKFKFSKIGAKDLQLLNQVYGPQRKMIQKEITRRLTTTIGGNHLWEKEIMKSTRGYEQGCC
jgi:hypothetical protein